MLDAPLRGAVVAAVVATLLASLSAQEPREIRPSSIMTLAISPAVVATVITRGEPVRITPGQLPLRPPTDRSGPVTLDLLVLWRGAPGWFLKPGGSAESGGGDSSGHVTVHAEKGGIALDVMLDTEKRVAQIAGNDVALGDANVVLVDSVDVAGGLTVLGTRTVTARIPVPPEGLADVFRDAPDLVPFLRCEARLPAPPAPKEVPAQTSAAVAAYVQQAMDASCARLQRK